MSLLNWLVATTRCYRVFTDGAIRPEKGLSGLAAIVRDDGGQICHWWSRRAGPMTCNQAEYEAIIMALEEVRVYRPAQLAVYTDSRVVVDQMLGRASVKSAGLRAPNARLRALVAELGEVHIFYIPREHNRLADALANDVVDGWRE